MFLLVPQARLPKRLDVAGAAERWSARLPALIEQRLRAESSMPASKGEQVIEARALGHPHFRPGGRAVQCWRVSRERTGG